MGFKSPLIHAHVHVSSASTWPTCSVCAVVGVEDHVEKAYSALGGGLVQAILFNQDHRRDRRYHWELLR